MTAQVAPFPVFRALDANGDPLAGGLLYTYAAGTTTPLATYTDQSGSTPNANPVVLDSAGTASVWYGSSAYKLVLKNAAGATQWTVDNFYASQGLADLANTTDAGLGDALVGVKRTFTGAQATTDHAFHENREINVKTDLNVDSTGAIDCTTAIQSALDSGKTVYFPEGTYKLTNLICTVAGQKIYGSGSGSVLLANDSTKPLFTVRADYVSISDIRINGTATAVATNHFGIFTDQANPAVGMLVQRVLFSGATAGVGLGHGIKFDDTCSTGNVRDCHFERLWGTSTSGYGVLVGKSYGVVVESCKFVGTTDRGRHAVYFSAGASGCIAAGNYIVGFNYEGLAQNAYGYTASQLANLDNVFEGNTIIGCGTVFAAGESGGIGVFGSNVGTRIVNNTVCDGTGHGIYFEALVNASTAWATGQAYIRGQARSNGGSNYVCLVAHTSGTFATDLAAGKWVVDNADAVVTGNHVYYNGFNGICVNGYNTGTMTGNICRNNGLASAYSGIRLMANNNSMGAFNWIVNANHSSGSVQNYAFEINSTSPIPTGTVLSGNYFPVCATSDLLLNGAIMRIDGDATWTTMTDPGTTGDWSPSVAGLSRCKIANGQTNTIKNFTGGRDGQQITLFFANANAITVSLDNCYLAGGAPFVSTVNDTLTLMKIGAYWYEAARSVN